MTIFVTMGHVRSCDNVYNRLVTSLSVWSSVVAETQRSTVPSVGFSRQKKVMGI